MTMAMARKRRRPAPARLYPERFVKPWLATMAQLSADLFAQAYVLIFLCRVAVHMSESLDLDYLSYVACDPRAEIRADLARQLVDCASDPATPETEVSALEPLLLRLADDVVSGVRKALAGQILAAPCPPRAVLFALISDTEEISLPLLTHASGFMTRDLAAIIRHADTVRQCAVARRQDLPGEICNLISASGCETVCAAMLDNETALIGSSDLSILSDRFAGQAEIRDRLLVRADLPEQLRVALICAIGELSAEDGQHDVAHGNSEDPAKLDEEREWKIIDVAGRAGQRDLAAIVGELHDGDNLTGSLLARAACAGDLRFVSVALGLLAGMPARRVDQLIRSLGATGCEAVCAKAELNETLQSLLTIASEVHRVIGRGSETIDPVGFTNALIEYVMTDTFASAPAERDALLRVIADCGAGEARTIARQIVDAAEGLAA